MLSWGPLDTCGSNLLHFLLLEDGVAWCHLDVSVQLAAGWRGASFPLGISYFQLAVFYFQPSLAKGN